MYSEKDARLAELALKGSANWTEEDYAYIEQEWRKMRREIGDCKKEWKKG